MIRWCCYCQHLLGEVPPLTNYSMTHGVCSDCAARFMGGEPLIEQNHEVIEFFRDLFSAAFAGDRRTCVQMMKRARTQGYRQPDLLVGLLQPALNKIGRQWEDAEVTIADEHRFTAWCETMLALLDSPPQPPGPLDILLLVAPGNLHVLGPRFAELSLLTSGINALCLTPELPTQEVLDLATTHAAAWLGYSCALPDHVASALDAIAQLRLRGYSGSFMISGQALRRSPKLAVSAPVQLVFTVAEAHDVIVAARVPGSRKV